MKRRRRDPIASLLADGEAQASPEQLADPEVRAELAEIRLLSEALRVPADIGQPDPFFLARFRQRRDALLATAQSAQSWRRVAQYLLPLAAGALLGAALAVWASEEGASALGELEMRELGNGVADVTFETTSVEPVLRIALGEL
jgi:anti-sigma factor RsiW